MPTALSRLCDQPDAFATAWPATPEVYAGTDLDALFAPEDAARICADRSLRPLQIGMVRHSTLSGEPPRADHPTDTLVLNGLHLTWTPLIEFCRRLEAELGHPMTANVYRTPPGEQGFNAHWDTHNVWLAQIQGTKTWNLSRPVFNAPLEHHTWRSVGLNDEQRRKAIDAPDHVVTLHAGQVLWIPRGWVHWGATGPGEPSMHITVGVHLLTWTWALEKILGKLSEDYAVLREALPPRLDTDTWPPIADLAGSMFSELTNDLAPADLAQPLRGAQHQLFNHAHH